MQGSGQAVAASRHQGIAHERAVSRWRVRPPNGTGAPTCIHAGLGIALICGMRDENRVTHAAPERYRPCCHGARPPFLQTEGERLPMTTNNLPTPFTPPALAPPMAGRAVGDLGFAESDGGLDWRRIRGALLHFKWLILGVTLLGTAAGVGATRVLAPDCLGEAHGWV